MDQQIIATEPTLFRLRLTFAKGESLRYVSHLDLARAWERVFRRAGLPLAHTQGFNPRPRFQIASGLPVGVSGREELMDLWLDRPVDAEEVLLRLTPVLPAGLTVTAANEVDLRAPALQALVRAGEYEVVLRSPEPIEAIRARIQALLSAAALPGRRHHKGHDQAYDLRPLIQTLSVEERAPGQFLLRMRLQVSPAGAGRPEQVIEALGLTLAARTAERTRLYFEFDNPQRDGIISVR